MRTVELKCENGHSWVTDINPKMSDENICKYFLNTMFETSSDWSVEKQSVCIECIIDGKKYTAKKRGVMVDGKNINILG